MDRAAESDESNVRACWVLSFVYTDVSNQSSAGGLGPHIVLQRNHNKTMSLKFSFTKNEFNGQNFCIYSKILE